MATIPAADALPREQDHLLASPHHPSPSVEARWTADQVVRLRLAIRAGHDLVDACSHIERVTSDELDVVHHMAQYHRAWVHDTLGLDAFYFVVDLEADRWHEPGMGLLFDRACQYCLDETPTGVSVADAEVTDALIGWARP